MSSSNILSSLKWIETSDALFALAYILGEEPKIEKKSDKHFAEKYLIGDKDKKSYECLNRLACLEDRRAHDILTVSKMTMKGLKYIKP